MAEPRVRYGRIGSPEGVALEDETGDEVLRVAGGAASGRVLDRGGSIFDAESEGIYPDGLTDCLPALQALEAKARTQRKAIRLKSGDGYVLSGTWNPTVPVVCDDVEPAVLLPAGEFQAIRSPNVPPHATTTVAEDISLFSASITVLDSSGVVAGDLIEIKSNSLWYYDHRNVATKGETHIVLSVSGNTIYTETPLWDSYDVGLETVTVTAFKPYTPYLENLLIRYQTPQLVTGVSLIRTRGGEITSIAVEGARYAGFALSACYGTAVNDARTLSANDPNTGYGVSIERGYGINVTRATSINCRRGVDYSGGYPSRGGMVSQSEASGTGLASDSTEMYENASGFGTHGPAESVRFIDNRVEHCAAAFVSRGRNLEFSRNSIVGRTRQIVQAAFGSNLIVHDNIYDAGITPLKPWTTPGNPHAFTALDFVVLGEGYDHSGFTSVKRNTAQTLQRSFVRVTAPHNGIFRGLELDDNAVQFRTPSGGNEIAMVAAASADLPFAASSVERNRITVFSGQYRMFRNLAPEFSTIDVSGYEIPPSSLESYGAGSGSLSNVSVRLTMDKRGKHVRIRGALSFTVAGGNTGLRLIDLPPSGISGQSGRYYSFSDPDYTEGLIVDRFGDGRVWVSGGSVSWGTAFTPGSYVLNLDYEYRLA